MPTKKCDDCDSCDCAEPMYGRTMYPRASAPSVVEGFEPGTKVRNPTANTEGVVKVRRYRDVVVHVTKQMIRPMGAKELEEVSADYEVIYDPKFLVVVE